MRSPANNKPPPPGRGPFLIPGPRGEHAHLAAPAQAEDAPVRLADAGPPRAGGPAHLEQPLDAGRDRGRLAAEPLDREPLLLGVGRVPRRLRVRAPEEVGHDHQGVERRGQAVRALQRLRGRAEDVVDEDYGLGGLRGARDVCPFGGGLASGTSQE